MNSEPARYGTVSMALHWGVAALIAAQFTVGLIMPEIHRGTKVEFWIGLHLSLGALIILLVLCRIAWRAFHPAPALTTLPTWQRMASHATHHSLYALLLVAPVLGWANASSRGWDASLFGILPLPRLVGEGSKIGNEMGDIHVVAVYTMLALIALHVAAALYHYFVVRDQVLQRMLPLSRGSS